MKLDGRINYSEIGIENSNRTTLVIRNTKPIRFLNAPRLNTTYFFNYVSSHIINYCTPITLSYAWSFGSLAGICLIIQMFSGIFLAMHYIPNSNFAFASIEFIMRDVKNGWLVRYIHANGVSMFFISVYAHIIRGMYYGSYIKPRELLWCSGVVLFFLMMATAFTGYVLPWGQMSFWGATVITSMVTIVPLAGKSIVQWFWAGYTIGSPTLTRIFSIHFFLPFLIAGVTIIHLALLHKVGSNSPSGSSAGIDDLAFYPYFVVKDIFAFSCFFLVFFTFVFYFPNALNHPDNYIKADPFETPRHVVPEWYFLPFYAILRSIPHKEAGILAMIGAIAILFTLPFINTSTIKNTNYRPLFRICFWFFISNSIVLMWLGQQPVKDDYVFTGQVSTSCYGLFFLLVPIIGKIESALAIMGKLQIFTVPIGGGIDATLHAKLVKIMKIIYTLTSWFFNAHYGKGKFPEWHLVIFYPLAYFCAMLPFDPMWLLIMWVEGMSTLFEGSDWSMSAEPNLSKNMDLDIDLKNIENPEAPFEQESEGAGNSDKKKETTFFEKVVNFIDDHEPEIAIIALLVLWYITGGEVPPAPIFRKK